jgi:hypothetical protein
MIEASGVSVAFQLEDLFNRFEKARYPARLMAIRTISET